MSENGANSQSFPVTIQASNIHVLTACDIATSGTPTGGYCPPVVTHADGTPVNANSHAKPGETVVIYAVGLGQTNPPMKTGIATPSPAPIIGDGMLYGLEVNLEFGPNAAPSAPYELESDPSIIPGPVAAYAGLVPGLVGLYQANVVIPAGAIGVPICEGTLVSNLTITIGGNASFDGAPICVDMSNP